MPFDYDLDFTKVDFRKRPDLYRVGKGEQGVLLVEPYKSELLPHWRFCTAKIAETSSRAIFRHFVDYLAADDFVGADMAQKFLQMGYTRSHRYANHAGGKKYAGPGRQEGPERRPRPEGASAHDDAGPRQGRGRGDLQARVGPRREAPGVSPA